MVEQKSYDVIVVGGGPGGSVCATYLSRAGHKVLLLDKAKFPRDKTCGDGISGKSMSILNDLGIIPEVEKQENAKIWGVLFASPKNTVVEIPFTSSQFASATPGFCSRRLIFDNVLFQNAKKHAETLEQFQVEEIIQENGQVVGVSGTHLPTKEKREFRAKVVVGADGANSVVAKKLGIFKLDPKHFCVALRAYYKNVKGLKDEIEFYFFDSIVPGYFWIFPISKDVANVGIGMLQGPMQKKKINLQTVMFAALKNEPLMKERFANAEMVGPVQGWSLPFGSKRWKNYGNGFVLVGDAASLIDPFTGEGIGNALSSARMAAKVIGEGLRSGDVTERKLVEYEKMLSEELDGELQASYKVQRLGTHKPLLNLFIDEAAHNPKVRQMMASTLASGETTKDMSSFGFLASLGLGFWFRTAVASVQSLLGRSS